MYVIVLVLALPGTPRSVSRNQDPRPIPVFGLRSRISRAKSHSTKAKRVTEREKGIRTISDEDVSRLPNTRTCDDNARLHVPPSDGDDNALPSNRDGPDSNSCDRDTRWSPNLTRPDRAPHVVANRDQTCSATTARPFSSSRI